MVLIRATSVGPLVISRSSRSTIARYSWANKIACDHVSVALAPFHSFSSLYDAPHRQSASEAVEPEVEKGGAIARPLAGRRAHRWVDTPLSSGFSVVPYDALGQRRSDGSWWCQRGPLSSVHVP
jgi:hypothetical protein